MGKSSRAPRVPLHVELLTANTVVPKKERSKVRDKRKLEALGREGQADVVDPRLTKRILQTAREQLAEEDAGSDADDIIHEVSGDPYGRRGSSVVGAFLYGEDDLPSDDERKMDALVPQSTQAAGGLAMTILQKIKEREALLQAAAQKAIDEPEELGIPQDVINAYRKVGDVMRRFKTGKLPKLFKIIPKLSNWEEILFITNPIKWTPNAMAAATRVFSSNLNEKMAQRFYNLILLPAVREDIIENRRLHFHHYDALKKAVYKPGAWMKGLFLPLALDGCTLREAVIIGSVLNKVSFPALHAAAALMKLAETEEWFGAHSYLIGTLVQKKLALPVMVVQQLVDHFHRFLEDNREMPVVWHQALLCFVQRYKMELDASQRKKLKALMKYHTHPLITTEIRRELFSPALQLQQQHQNRMQE